MSQAAPQSPEVAPLTAVVFAYQQAPVVEEAIRSVFAQTLQPAEIILSDDGSRDETHQIMLRLAAEYHGPAVVKVRRTEGGSGWLAHINTCLRLAAHPVLVCAGDDVSKPERVARFAAELASHPAARLIWSPMERMRADGTLTGETMGIRSYTAGRLRGVGASQCWHRDLIDVFGDLPAVPAAEDIVLPFRAWLLGGLRHLPEPLVNWRDRDYRQLNREQLDATYEVRATVFRVNAARILLDDLATFESRHPERSADFAGLRRRLLKTLDGASAEHEAVSAPTRLARAVAILRLAPRLGFKRARRLWQDQVWRLPAYLDSAYPRGLRRWLPRTVALAAGLATAATLIGRLPTAVGIGLGLAVLAPAAETCRMGMRYAAAKLWRPA